MTTPGSQPTQRGGTASRQEGSTYGGSIDSHGNATSARLRPTAADEFLRLQKWMHDTPRANEYDIAEQLFVSFDRLKLRLPDNRRTDARATTTEGPPAP